MTKSSIDPNLLITVGAVAIGGYLIYKVFNDSGVKATTSGIGNILGGLGQTSQGLGAGITTAAGGLGKGISDSTTGIGQGIGEIGKGIGSPFNMIDTAFDAISNKILNNQMAAPTIYPQGQTTAEIVGQGQSIYGMSAGQIVQNVATSSGSSSGGGKAVIVTPMYDPVSGTGVDSAGYGYSSAFNLGARGTGTGVVIIRAKNSSSTFGKSYI